MTDNGPGRARPDINTKDVALRWLTGNTVLTIAIELDTTETTIRNRLKKARELYPELPWDERKPTPESVSTKMYLRMNDGKEGARALPYGSIVNGRPGRRR